MALAVLSSAGSRHWCPSPRCRAARCWRTVAIPRSGCRPSRPIARLADRQHIAATLTSAADFGRAGSARRSRARPRRGPQVDHDGAVGARDGGAVKRRRTGADWRPAARDLICGGSRCSKVLLWKPHKRIKYDGGLNRLPERSANCVTDCGRPPFRRRRRTARRARWRRSRGQHAGLPGVQFVVQAVEFVEDGAARWRPARVPP